MTRWLTSWVAGSLILTLFAVSGYLWLNASDSSKEADLAANAVAGGIIALAVLVLERSLHRSQERQQQMTLLATAADIRGVNFHGQDLHAAYAAGGKDLSKCDFSKANLRNARLSEANCGHTDFGGADLRGADIRWANLAQADLKRADLRSADLGASSLTGADLSDADLRRANMFERYAGSPYRGADLRGAALFGADLRDVALVVRDRHYDDHTVGVALDGAWANDETKWPSQFAPAAAGVRLLPGKQRREHNYHRAFKDPGFDDVTATTDAGDWTTDTHLLSQPGRVVGLRDILGELEAIRIALIGDDAETDSDDY